ncbi:hypothetical protein GUJ93_ZPchr0007g3451 [Zizania palustris]|uniref:glucan endo-1,3-beta-D-glucosidase n=1 Tax=Zizania palustris TaxID=103762 RepID=A0A8J5SQT8_ZIZPA|nr:hypothetical protein GUJ93_ZPchr0007g3451 [Zizania palustris]
MEYLHEFNRLARYEPEEVRTDALRQAKFLRGLKDELSIQLVATDYADFQRFPNHKLHTPTHHQSPGHFQGKQAGSSSSKAAILSQRKLPQESPAERGRVWRRRQHSQWGVGAEDGEVACSSSSPSIALWYHGWWCRRRVGVVSGEPYVGVTIGTAVTNLLSPSDLAEFLRAQRITHVRLYDADPRLLSALASSGARAIVGVPNDELLALGSSPATATAWVSRRVLPFAGANSSSPGLITAIAVGDEVPTALPSALPVLLPAIQSLAAALAAANLSSIPVSTPLPFSVVFDPFPPSQAFFNQSLAKSFLLPLLSHLANTSAPLMLNLYPYYSLMQSNGVVPLDNALFKPLPPSMEMVDPNTLLHYTNVLDAMLDAVHVAVKNLNVTSVPVLVTETGWPSYGDRKTEPYATRDNADAYNSNLIKHITDKPGTPMRPGTQASVYIYELFNEDLRPGPVSEANWGLFHGNGTPVYLLHVSGAGGFPG